MTSAVISNAARPAIRPYSADLPFPKDGIHNYLVHGKPEAVNPDCIGTKVAAHYSIEVPAVGVQMMRLRLSDCLPSPEYTPFGSEFDSLVDMRRREADEFFASILRGNLSADARGVMRQAFAGTLWAT